MSINYSIFCLVEKANSILINLSFVLKLKLTILWYRINNSKNSLSDDRHKERETQSYSKPRPPF